MTIAERLVSELAKIRRAGGDVDDAIATVNCAVTMGADAVELRPGLMVPLRERDA